MVMRKLKGKQKIAAAAVLIILTAVFCWFQNNFITVSEYEYRSEKIAGGLDGYTIVHISDLHNKMFGKEQKRLISKIEDCHPDIIVVTGDIVDSADSENAITFTEEAVKLAPVFYVTGNHEEYLDGEAFKKLTEQIEAAGAIWLSNETVEITTYSGKKALTLTGLDNRNLQDGTLSQLMGSIDHDNVMVLLAHQPQFIEFYAQQGPDIVFSGHAHGGQWRLPFIGGLIAPGQGFFPEYTEGSYVSGSTTMYISRGLGNSIFPLRLFNCPEVVCAELKSQ